MLLNQGRSPQPATPKRCTPERQPAVPSQQPMDFNFSTIPTHNQPVHNSLPSSSLSQLPTHRFHHHHKKNQN